jgi:hypothetical protein
MEGEKTFELFVRMPTHVSCAPTIFSSSSTTDDIHKVRDVFYVVVRSQWGLPVSHTWISVVPESSEMFMVSPVRDDDAGMEGAEHSGSGEEIHGRLLD